MSSRVTAGEGAESDDDTGQSLSFMKNTMVTSTMVSGEASETDEEDDDADEQQTVDDDDQMHPPGESSGDPAPIVIDTLEIEDPLVAKHGKGRKHKLVFKYDSPFHRKLRERNLQMRSSLVEGTTQLYKSTAYKLVSSTFYLTKAQMAVEDVAYQSKIILEDLESLETALQNIVDLDFLPTLKTSHS